ncbi:MAG: alpha-L-arabinofuranosidase [Verrucomicrobiia bacterium]
MHRHRHLGINHFFCIEPRNLLESAFRKLTLRCWLVLAGTACLTLVSPALANDDQLVYSQMLNNGWQDWGWVPHYATNNPTFNGTNSMVFAASSSWQAWSLAHDPMDTTLYTSLTLWLNGGSKGGQTVGVQAEAGSTWGTQIQVKAPTNVWQQFTFSLASLGVGNVTNLAGIQIWNNSTLQSNFYIAGITLIAAPTPAIVHVSVNAANLVRKVDSRVFGINTAAWDGYLDTPGTSSILTNINNQALRWPGGSWGDGYHWTNEAWMDGATNARTWGSFTTNFIHVATNTLAQVYMIANYGSSTPAEAAFGVRMCNVTNHAGFKYWEIGNEVGGGWETDNNTNAPWQPHDPWTYASRFKDYYNQMKAVDPTIKIGAVADITEDGTANYTNHPVVNPRTGVTHNGWTPVMLTYMRSNNVTPDFLISHNYAPGDGDTYNLLWTKTWAGSAANLRQMLNDYLGNTVAANVELNGTEFGPSGDKQWISLVGGLFYADMIGQILQTEFNAFLWWDLRNGQGTVADSDNALYGWRTNSSGTVLTDEGIVNGNALPPNSNFYPSYYCMKLMQYFARVGDTVVTATNDYQLLGTYAVRRANGSLTMLVVNKSSYASLNAAVSLAGYAPFSNATVYSYGIPQDNAARTGIGSLDVAQTNVPVLGANFSYIFPPFSATVLRLTPTAPSLGVPSSPPPPPGQFVFQLQGLSGVPYVIQMSTNLAAPNWMAVSTNTPAGGTLDLTNPRSSDAQFYRAVWNP